MAASPCRSSNDCHRTAHTNNHKEGRHPRHGHGLALDTRADEAVRMAGWLAMRTRTMASSRCDTAGRSNSNHKSEPTC
ncbi:hypothetical protein KC333_g144 [Hortaea werneckii]|nr:hypothetical protein KC333_g144 [Hortaea werneckii]